MLTLLSTGMLFDKLGVNIKSNMTVELFNQEFEGIIDHLKSYLLRMTTSISDAEDITHNTYIKSLNNLPSFRGESSIKTWIFTIASNLAKDNLSAQKRWTENVTDITKDAALANREFFPESMNIRMSSETGQYEAKEHIALCFTCISKSLPLEQQLCLLLKEVYEFKVSEISTILNSTEAMVKYYLYTGRSKMITIFEGRCALINKTGVCHQCSELNGIYNPKQNTQVELMKIDMVKEAAKNDKEHLFDLRMKILKEIDPFKSKASALQLHHLEHNRQVMEKYIEKISK